MRLDNYLTKSRLIKRRSLAKAACDRGIVSVDGRVAKASKEIFAGQRITIDFASRILEAEVLRIPGGNISRKDSRDLFRILKETRKEEEYL